MNANSTGKSPWGGWLLHAAVGLVLTAVLAVLGTPRVALLVSVLAMGIAHEIGDGDLRRANGIEGAAPDRLAREHGEALRSG
jgi:hypothetical protein